MKKVKWVLLILLSLVIVFVGGVCFYIFVGENEETKATKAEMENITSTVIAHIDTELASEDSDASEPGQEAEAAGDEVVEQSEQEKSGIANKQTTDISQKEKRILKIYDAAFYELQASANGIVDGLLVSIKTDYDILKGRNEASPDRLMQLGASYTKRANALEGQVDSSVNVVLDKMGADMKAQGIQSDRIAGYRKAYEEEYSRQKETRRSAIMNKAQEMM